LFDLLMAGYFLFSWISVLVVSWYLFRCCGLKLTRITIPSIVYISFVLINYLGLPLLYFYMFPDYYNLGVRDRELIWRLWFMSSACLLLMLMGFLFAKNVLKFQPLPYILPYYKNYVTAKFEVIIILVLSLVVFIRYYNLAYIPLLELIKGNVTDMFQARSDVNLFPGKMWRYQLVFRSILPFISYYLFALCLMRRPSKPIILLGLTFFFTLFVNLMNFYKGPIVHLLVGLFFVYILQNKKSINIRYILIVGFCLLFVTMTSYVVFMNKTINPRLALSPVKRVLTGEISSAYFYLKMFPEYHDYLYEKSLPNPGGILPFEHYETAKRVQDFIRPDLREMGKHGSSPAAFWVGIYAGFGKAFTFFVSFCVGVLIFSIHYLVSKGRLTPLKIALIAWMALHYSKLSVTFLGKYVIDTNLIAILMCYVLIKYGVHFRKLAVVKTPTVSTSKT